MEPIRVIIADDEESIRAGLHKLIDWERRGFRIDGLAANGRQALALLEGTGADLVITDVRMPVMDGLELIRRVREQYDAEIVILSGHSEFGYAQKAVEYGVNNYLLKPIDESLLLATLERVREKILNKRSSRDMIAQGKTRVAEKKTEELLFYDLSREEAEMLCSQLELRAENMFFCVSALRVFVGKRYADQAGMINLNIFKMLEETMALPAMGGIRVNAVYKHDLFFLLCYAAKAFLPRIKAPLHTLGERFSQLGIGYLISIGRVVDDPVKIGSSRVSALAGVEQTFFLGVDRIVDMETVVRATAAVMLPDWDENTLLNRIRAGDSAGLPAEIDEMFRPLRTGSHSPRTVRTIVMNAVFKINQLLMERESSLSHIFGEMDVQDAVMQSRTVEQLRAWFLDFCLRTADHLSALRDIQGYSTAVKVRDVIDRDFAKELHLKMIAEELFFSADYLGRLFKSTYGVGFNEYLNGRRIEAAKRMLTGSSQSIARIAALVGFQNVDYFTRLFKKREGITPNSFRYMKRQEGHES